MAVPVWVMLFQIRLDPETSKTWELGMKRQLTDRDSVDISLYNVKTKDKIEYTYFYLPGTSTTEYKQYINYGVEKRRGIELNYEHKFTDNLTSYVNYAWQSGKVSGPKLEDTNKSGYSNAVDYSVPKHIFHAGLAYDKEKWTGLLDMQYVSARQSSTAAAGEYGAYDGYFLVNTSVGYRVTLILQLNLVLIIYLTVNSMIMRQLLVVPIH